MPFSVFVKIVLSDAASSPLAGVTVRLFDRDSLSADDLLGTGITDAMGNVPFTFSTAQYADIEDVKKLGFPPKMGLPDLYVVVYGNKGEKVLSTRSQAAPNALPSSIVVPVELALALQHGLLISKSARSEQIRKKAWLDDWKTRKQKPGGTIDLCVARVVLDMMSGATHPKNALQKQLASRVSMDDLTKAAGFAKQALALMDSSGLGIDSHCNSGRDPKDLWQLFSGSGGPLQGIAQALNATDPAPNENLPATASAGLPFLNEAEWRKECRDDYQNTHGGQMPDPVRYVAPPQINRIRSYDNLTRHFIRDEDPNAKELTIKVLDGTSSSGWNEDTIHLDVPLDSPDSLVNKASSNGRQISVMDVLPLQTVVMYGSGFIAEKARLIVKHHPWRAHPTDGRLEPEQFDLPIIGWNQQETVPVYGALAHSASDRADTFTGDYVVFDWPEKLAEVGLYELQLEFENRTDPRYPSTLVQNPPPDCHFVATSRPVATQSVWFAVLPVLEERKVSPRVTHVQCVDETDPERIGPFNYFDDMIVQASAQVRHIALDESDTQPDVVTQNTPDAPEHMFWNSGDGWDLDLHLLASSNDPIALRFDRILAPQIAALEIFGATDRALLKIVLVVAYVALLVLFTAILTVAIVACVAAAMAVLVAAGCVTAGVATGLGVTLLGSLFVFLGPLVAAIWGVLLVGGIGAIVGLVDHLPIGPDVIVSALPLFQGSEVAHLLSPYRFHRRLWLLTRPQHLGSTVVSTSTDFSSPAQPKLIETYAASACGGRYEVRLELVAPLL